MPASNKTLRPLDLVNLALIDVNGAIKPYLNVFLYVKRDWSDAAIGLVGTIAGLAGILAQAPAGAAIDAVRDKRKPLLAALLVLSIGTVLIGVSPTIWPVVVGSILIASVAGVLSPAVAALTIVVTRKGALTRRMGRNSAFERAGNVAAAVAIGVIGWLLPDRAVFLMVPALCILAAAALFSVRSEAAPSASSGEDESSKPEAGGWRILFASRPFFVFATCAGLFHFANSPLLTLVAQDIAQDYPHWSSTVISVCIIGAQAVMVPMALLVGHRADRWGRKPLLVTAFLALPLRAILYCVSANPFWQIGVQLLDGVGAGLLSAAKPLVVADLMRASGKYNLALGIVGTLQGIGAALAAVVAGSIVSHAGFKAAYLTCGTAALVGFAILLVFMPETRQTTQES